MLVGYMRVSSESDRETTDLQRDALLATGVDGRHLFEDHASGAKDDRPGLVKALAFVRPGDVLVVWKLDRLGRSLSHLLSIVNALKENQVAFRSLAEGMDTTTASGALLFHVFGALAQYERALTRERVVAGLAAARRRGRVVILRTWGRLEEAMALHKKVEALCLELGNKDGLSRSYANQAFVLHDWGDIHHELLKVVTLATLADPNSARVICFLRFGGIGGAFEYFATSVRFEGVLATRFIIWIAFRIVRFTFGNFVVFHIIGLVRVSVVPAFSTAPKPRIEAHLSSNLW
jgi:DNA invertase Pin-like site-specific DNA recombinase